MGVLDKLSRKIERILLIGHTAHGKTYNAVRIALNLANKKKRVLYIDNEYGSLDEWDELKKQGKITKEIDKNIVLVTPNDFLEFKDYALNFQDKVHAIIIDPFSLNMEARITAREQYLRVGKVWRGEKEIPIEDRVTFHLTGFDYQLPNEWQMEVLRGLAKGKVHFIVTEMIPTKVMEEIRGKERSYNIDKILTETDETRLPKRLKELFDFFGYFDKVILCEREIRNGRRKYYGVIIKWRGRDLSGMRIDNVYEFLLRNTKLLR